MNKIENEINDEIKRNNDNYQNEIKKLKEEYKDKRKNNNIYKK